MATATLTTPDKEAAQIVAGHMATAPAEIASTVAKLRDATAARIEAWKAREGSGAPPAPAAVEAFALVVLPLLLRRRRAEDVGAVLPGGASVKGRPGLASEFLDAVEAWVGPTVNEVLAALKASVRARLQGELDQVLAQLARFETPLPPAALASPHYDPGRSMPGWIGRSDVILYEVTQLVTRRRDLAARVAALDPSGPVRAESAADHVGVWQRFVTEWAIGPRPLSATSVKPRSPSG